MSKWLALLRKQNLSSAYPTKPTERPIEGLPETGLMSDILPISSAEHYSTQRIKSAASESVVTDVIVQSCSTCVHRTPANTCGEPIKAGLADRFSIVWLDMMDEQGALCAAYAQRARLQADSPTVFTIRSGIQSHGLNNAHKEKSSAYYAKLSHQHRLDSVETEKFIAQMLLRDSQFDERRTCIECRHLNRQGRCEAAGTGLMRDVSPSLEPTKLDLIRCCSFSRVRY